MKSYLILLPIILIQISSFAQSGTLDLTFGEGGKVLVANDNVKNIYFAEARAVALQKDGKIITAGSGYQMLSFFVITRHHPNGKLDSSFSDDGIAFINPGAKETFFQNAIANDIDITPEGKILVTGPFGTYDNNRFVSYTTVVKLNTDGSLDNSFGSNGIVNLKISTENASESASGIALQQDGKILLTGNAFEGSIGNKMTLVRLHADGSLDNTFDADGILFVKFNEFFSEGIKVMALPDGKIAAIGLSINNSLYYQYDFAVARLNADGSFDYSFDGDGKAVVDLDGTHDFVADFALQPDGKLILAGDTYNNFLNEYDMSVARLNTDGSLDQTFDADGKRVINILNYDNVEAVTIQKDGRILLAGSSFDSFHGGMNITKLLSNGTTDNSFDTDGTALIDFGSAFALTLQPDGNIVVAGSAYHGSNFGRAIIRLLNDDIQFTLNCPGNIQAETVTDGCYAIVTGIDPLVTPSNALVNYVIQGPDAAMQTGTGSVSGKKFALGISTVMYSLTDDPGNRCSFTVTVSDKIKPVITLSGAGASPNILWPPDHKMRTVAINYTSSDNCSSDCKISSIVSNEASNGLGDGDTDIDWEIINNRQVKLRAERSGKGDGRIYTITITCTDRSGNASSKVVLVTVPKNQKKGTGSDLITYSTAAASFPEEKIMPRASLKMSLYPNPVSATLTVRLEQNKTSKAEVSLINTNGSVVERKSVQINGSGQIISFNVKNYPAGIYFIEVLTSEGIKRGQVMIQR